MAKQVKYVSPMFRYSGDTRTPLQRAEQYIKNHPNGHIYAERGPCEGYAIYDYVRNSELQQWEHDKIADGLTKEQIEKLGVRIGWY